MAAFAGAELLNRITRPALLLSMERKVSHVNPAGRQYLADGDALLLSNDRLIAFDPKSDDGLSQSFQSMVGDLPQGNAPPSRGWRWRCTRASPSAKVPWSCTSRSLPSKPIYATCSEKPAHGARPSWCRCWRVCRESEGIDGPRFQEGKELGRISITRPSATHGLAVHPTGLTTCALRAAANP